MPLHIPSAILKNTTRADGSAHQDGDSVFWDAALGRWVSVAGSTTANIETRLGGASAPDSTETSYVNGVTSAIQTQLDAKALKTSKYIVAEATGDLSAEVSLGALTTGLLKHTVAAGVSTPATAVAGSDYLTPIDPSPDADHGYSGTVISGTAGEALAINNLVYLKTDGKFWKAKADAAGTMPAVGITTAAADAEAVVVVLLWGFIRNDDGWGGNMTIGSPTGRIWVSAATAGLATQTQPAVATNLSQGVGYAVAARIALFDFNRTLVTVA